MTFSFKSLWLVLIAGSVLFGSLPSLSAAETRDAKSVLNGMRLKRWTKDLELTEDQQKKIQVLLDDEAKQITKMEEDTALSPTDRSVKITEFHKDTYGKMKPLLNAKQLETFEKSLTKSSKSKKR